MHTDTVSAQLLRLNWLVRARVVETKLRDLKRAVKAGFDPNQPRVPAGSGRPSGRWTDGGGGSGGVGTHVAQNIPRSGRGSGQVRLRSGQLAAATPAQEARHAVAQAQAARAVRQVRELDPSWRPKPSATETVEGEIASFEVETQEAQARLRELARQPAEDLAAAYRQQHGLDLLGEPVWSRKQNTVALCKVDGIAFVGVNSGAFTYGDADQSAGESLRETLLEAYPDLMSTGNIGQFPNDALFHAETTCLLRAARARGGELSGQTVEVYVDREMCPSCEKVLPYIGLELGNPTVTFVDPMGRVRILRDGYWIK